MKEIILKVEGMVCGGCENRVVNALKTIEGVNKVEASYRNGIVKVEATNNIQKDLLKEKIEDIGVEVKEN